MAEKSMDYIHDITYYAKDGRLTEPSDGKRYKWREMIDFSRKLGRPLTDEEAEKLCYPQNEEQDIAGTQCKAVDIL